MNAASSIPDLNLLETLKWGQPSWLPDHPHIGSTLRVSWPPPKPDQIGKFLNCNSTLVETMRALYPNDFTFEGALYLDLDAPLPDQAIADCATLTLTYHRKTA